MDADAKKTAIDAGLLTQHALDIVESSAFNKEHWELPAHPIKVSDNCKQPALDLKEAIEFFHLATSMEELDGIVALQSKGYYHYVGS